MPDSKSLAESMQEQFQAAIRDLKRLTSSKEEFQILYHTAEGETLLIDDIVAEEPDLLRLYAIDADVNPCAVLGHATNLILSAVAVEREEPEAPRNPIGFDLRRASNQGA